jgi:hypothetical protein
LVRWRTDAPVQAHYKDMFHSFPRTAPMIQNALTGEPKADSPSPETHGSQLIAEGASLPGDRPLTPRPVDDDALPPPLTLPIDETTPAEPLPGSAG